LRTAISIGIAGESGCLGLGYATEGRRAIGLADSIIACVIQGRAVWQRTGYTDTLIVTGVIGCTPISIRVTSLVWGRRKHAPCVRVTRIKCACRTIITVRGNRSIADPCNTHVNGCASVSVITIPSHRREDATTGLIWVTAVNGAAFTVIARDGERGSRTSSQSVARVILRATVSIIASKCIGQVDASNHGVATIVCAEVAIVAIRSRTSQTGSGLAAVVRGAFVSIRTRRRPLDRGGGAAVSRVDVTYAGQAWTRSGFTIFWSPSTATPVGAGVVESAGVAVFTGSTGWEIGTAVDRIAAIGGTDLSVITIDGDARTGAFD